MHSSLASNNFDIGVCVCVFVRACKKGNFVNEQGNRRELVDTLRVRTVGGLS